MRQIQGRSLWIGNAGDLADPRRVFDAEIEAVVELADSEPLADLPRSLIRCRFPLSDGGENPNRLIRLAVRSVADFLRMQIPVLVCCSAGMSRSVSIAAAAIAMIEKRQLPKALEIVTKDGPADVSPGLIRQIENVLEDEIS